MSSGFFKSAGSSVPKRTSLVPACGACGLHKKCKTPKQEPVGEGKRGILLVAPRPSIDSEGDEVLFGGSSNSYVRKVLDDFDVDMDRDCWSVGAIACYRSGGDTNSQEVEYCSPLFEKAIKELEPKVIIPFGFGATLAAVFASGVSGPMPSSWPGWRIPDQTRNAWICPTFHPSEVSGDKAKDVVRLIFRQHIEAALKFKNKPWPNGPPSWKDDIKRIYSDAEAEKEIRRFVRQAIEEGDMVAWDYETNMLKPDPDNSKIVCCSLARGKKDVKETLAYPWGPGAREATGEFLRSNIPKIAANIKFEDRWTRKHFGHRVRNWVWDTVVQGHVLDNRTGVSGVKFQAYVLLGQPEYDKAIHPYLACSDSMGVNNIHKVELSKLLLYCGLDSLLEFKLAIRQSRLMGYQLGQHE